MIKLRSVIYKIKLNLWVIIVVFLCQKGVEDKECGPLIKTIMTRCIRVQDVLDLEQKLGIDYFGTFNEVSTEIGNYIPKLFDSVI